MVAKSYKPCFVTARCRIDAILHNKCPAFFPSKLPASSCTERCMAWHTNVGNEPREETGSSFGRWLTLPTTNFLHGCIDQYSSHGNENEQQVKYHGVLFTFLLRVCCLKGEIHQSYFLSSIWWHCINIYKILYFSCFRSVKIQSIYVYIYIEFPCISCGRLPLRKSVLRCAFHVY